MARNVLSNQRHIKMRVRKYLRIIERTIPYYIGVNELDNELWLNELNIIVRIKKSIKPLPCGEKVVTLHYQIKRNTN